MAKDYAKGFYNSTAWQLAKQVAMQRDCASQDPHHAGQYQQPGHHAQSRQPAGALPGMPQSHSPASTKHPKWADVRCEWSAHCHQVPPSKRSGAARIRPWAQGSKNTQGERIGGVDNASEKTSNRDGQNDRKRKSFKRGQNRKRIQKVADKLHCDAEKAQKSE